MGRAALKMSRPDLALEQAEIEKKANPNLADAYLLAAESHSALGQFNSCAGEYQKAMKLRAQGANILVKLAKCYRQGDNLDAALVMLQQASKQESGYAEIYKEMGQVLEKKGDLERAMESYNQYLILDPNAKDRSFVEERIQALSR